MPRATTTPVTAVRMSSGPAAVIAEIQRALPVATYVKLLHDAATTGSMPKFDRNGKPTGEFDALDVKDRMATARYLIDKIMPSAPTESVVTTRRLDGTEPIDMRALSDVELRAIAAGTADATVAPADAAALSAMRAMDQDQDQDRA